MEEPTEEYRDLELEEFEEDHAVQKAEKPESKTLERQAVRKREAILEKYETQMTVSEKEFSLFHAGRASDLVDELGLLDVGGLRLSVGETTQAYVYRDMDFDFDSRIFRPYPLKESNFSALLTLHRRKGVSLEVYGSDTSVVRGSFANFEAAVRKGVPWYAFLRAPWMWFVYTAVALIAALIGAWPWLSDDTDVLPVVLIVGAIALGLGSLLQVLARFVLPGLEITQTGQRARGLRGLAFIGTVVLNFAIGMVEDGLHDRAFTRDLEWGIPLPVDDLGPGKTIYVWWEALMGYLSAPQEWARLAGEPDAWKAWWEDPGAESYYFIGKDNIPFHAVYWPALLMGYGGLNLPTDVPSNQFVTFGGEQASASRGIGRSIGWYTERFEPDALRYAVSINFPETSDTEITVEDLVKRVNEELVATWGNLVNRVVAMTGRYFDSVVPAAVDADERDAVLIASVDATLDEVGDLIGAIKLRAGLQRAMAGAQTVNAYLNEREPWKTAADDTERTGTTLKVALDAIAGIAVALYPYLPFTTTRVLRALGVELGEHGPSWRRPEIAGGTKLSELGPLYAKMEPIDEEE
ncbi:MAG: class I tRNA ligase family protein [Acidobacteria bacterium]|nr:class I tRNA ligase family protein [Acidobacteriota bacterium]